MEIPTNWLEYFSIILPIVNKGIQWVRNRIKWRGISEDARKIAFAFNSFSWANLQQPLPAISQVGIIERPEIQQIRLYWQTANSPLILHGEAGSGKSGIALRLGQILSNDGIPVLFIKVTDFATGYDPVEILQNRMPLNYKLMDSIAKLSKERVYAIIIDQLDSIAGTDLCKNFVSFIKSLVAFPRVNILVVSRSYELMQDPEISSLGFFAIESGKLTNEQAIFYLSKIGITSPPQTLIDLSRNLLHLSLIADVEKISPLNVNGLTNEVNLWKQFYCTIKEREGEEVAEYAQKLAREVTSRNEHTFLVQVPKNELIRKLLSRRILITTPGRRYAFRHEQLQDFLCSYSLLPEQLNLLQIINEFGKYASGGILKWLHLLYKNELPELELRFINDVLTAKEYLPFYSRIPILENLRKQQEPTREIAQIIEKYSGDWAYNRFFFENLENSGWISALYNIGFYFRPPNPVEVRPGSFQLPPWPAGEYLVRFADQFEDISIEIIRSIQTENWQVQLVLINVMLKISPRKLSKIVGVVDEWLNGRFSEMLPNDLKSLAEYLFQNGYIDSAIQILEFIITPILPREVSEYSKYRSALRFRSDHFWVNEYCEKQISKLIQSKPRDIVFVFERQILKSIKLCEQLNPKDAERQVGYYWRMDIPNRESDRSNADVLDILIDGLIEGLAEVCKQSLDDNGNLLKSFLNSEHIIFKRVALYTLRNYGKDYPELINQALLQREFLESSEFANEYRGLMRDQFNNISQEVRTQVITWILSGPVDVDSRANRHAKWENREATDDDRRIVLEDWILFHLEIIRNYLTDDALFRLNELTALHGKPDIEERPRFVTTSWGGALSPVSIEELAMKSFDELKQFFKDYVPKDLFLNPRESLAQTFMSLVSESPTRYCEFASYLNDPTIRFIYIYNYFLGIREGVKNKSGKLVDEIIGLCEYVVVQKDDPFKESSGEYEPGLFTTQLEIARLLEESLRSDDPYLTRQQLNRIRSILISLSYHPDPKLDEDGTNSLDPFTQSLNCVRGEAMHGIFHYSLYVIHQQEKKLGEKLKKGYLEPEIQQILEEKLDLSNEQSLAVHAVFGGFIPQIFYLSPEWLEKNLAEIFPENEKMTSYWKAAWDAYIITSNVYIDVFKLLIPQYQRGLELLCLPEEEKKHIGSSPDERLAQHIMSAYLADLTNFDFDNNLLSLFFNNASDAIRAQGIFWLSQVLGNNKPTSDDVLWKKCWALWQKRLDFAETQDVSKNTQEISDYLRWLPYCPIEFDILYAILCKSVKYLHNGFDSRQITEYASRYCEKYPFESVTLLRMTIHSAKKSWWGSDEKVEEKILQTAIGSMNEKAKQIALDIINYHGDLGDFRWKHLLE